MSAVGGTKFVTGRMRLVMDDGKTIEYGPETSLTCRQVTANPVSVRDGMGGHDQMLAAVFVTKHVTQGTHTSVVDARPLPSEQRCDMRRSHPAERASSSEFSAPAFGPFTLRSGFAEIGPESGFRWMVIRYLVRSPGLTHGHEDQGQTPVARFLSIVPPFSP